MRIDAHVHLWERNIIPDQAVKSYLEPLKKLKELGLDDVFDFRLDDDVPFSDYNENIQDYIDVMDYNRLDAMVVLGIDFGLVNEVPLFSSILSERIRLWMSSATRSLSPNAMLTRSPVSPR